MSAKFDDFLKEQMRDPEFKEEFDSIQDERNTLSYYNSHYSSFIKQTQKVDFSRIQDVFLSFVVPQGFILDLGCGSGRDTKYFLERGFNVDPIDGSDEMCREASEFTGIQVHKMLFQDLTGQNHYDGIWACASILHLHKQELVPMFTRIRSALKKNGIFYASFKYGDFEGMRDGRYYTDLTEESLMEIVKEACGFEVLKLWVTADVREERKDQGWINIILKKLQIN